MIKLEQIKVNFEVCLISLFALNVYFLCGNIEECNETLFCSQAETITYIFVNLESYPRSEIWGVSGGLRPLN